MPKPTNAARFVMISTPNIPQPYQERFLTALENSSRPETSSERWNRERDESRERWSDAIHRLTISGDKLVAAFRLVGVGASFAAAKIEPLCRLIIEAERGSPIGRKRRARRARGRR
jgi:hypothetical protein